MLSRIMWISIAGIALVAGMIIQGGGKVLGWFGDTEISAKAEAAITDRIEHAVEGSVAKMDVVGSDGREVEIPEEAKQAMADAVGRLVKAETDLAIARVGDSTDEEIKLARANREKARADVDRLKEQFEQLDEAANSEKAALREQVRREIREDIRASVRESVGS